MKENNDDNVPRVTFQLYNGQLFAYRLKQENSKKLHNYLTIGVRAKMTLYDSAFKSVLHPLNFNLDHGCGLFIKNMYPILN